MAPIGDLVLLLPRHAFRIAFPTVISIHLFSRERDQFYSEATLKCCLHSYRVVHVSHVKTTDRDTIAGYALHAMIVRNFTIIIRKVNPMTREVKKMCLVLGVLLSVFSWLFTERLALEPVTDNARGLPVTW